MRYLLASRPSKSVARIKRRRGFLLLLPLSRSVRRPRHHVMFTRSLVRSRQNWTWLLDLPACPCSSSHPPSLSFLLVCILIPFLASPLLPPKKIIHASTPLIPSTSSSPPSLRFCALANMKTSVFFTGLSSSTCFLSNIKSKWRNHGSNKKKKT